MTKKKSKKKLQLKKLILISLHKHLSLLIYAIFFLIASWLIYFSYNNVYTTVILPKKIEQSEIVAKKQKVNLDLFNTINEKILEKKSVNVDELQSIKNPF